MYEPGKKALPFPGADVIERKTPRFIACRPVGHEQHWGNRARHEWPSLALDDIGAWEIHLLFSSFTGGKS